MHRFPDQQPCESIVSPRVRPAFICLLLIAATLAIYWPVVFCDFVPFDDPAYVKDNLQVQAGVTWAGARWAFTTGHTGNWHPLTWLSHMLDVELFGSGAGGPHLVNVLLHAANSVLLFLWLWQLTKAGWRSAIVGALFALHPLHVESVAWISERKDVLSTFFGLLSLLLFARFAQESGDRSQESGTTRSEAAQSPVSRLLSPEYCFALLFFALGLMSKPMLVTLPFVLLLLDYWPLKRFQLPGASKRSEDGSTFSFQLFREKLPFFLLSGISCVVTFFVQRSSGAVSRLGYISLGGRIENAFVSVTQYLWQTIWPAGLAIFYPHPGHWPGLQVALAVLLLFGSSAGVLWFSRRFPFMFTGWFWFVGTLIPVIGLVQVGTQARADRYMYLPSVGLFILLTWGGGQLASLFLAASRRFVSTGAVVCLMLLAFAARTSDQLRHWHDGGTLARHAIAVTKDNYVAHNILGTYLLEQNQPAAAAASFRRAIEIKPSDARAYNNLGYALYKQGHAAEAMECYRQSLARNPDFVKPLENLGYLLARAGRLPEAMECYQRTLQLEPDSLDALNNLGNLLADQGRAAEAISYYRRALHTSPNYAEAWVNLGRALARQNQQDKAIECYTQSLRIQPNLAEALYNLGNALVRQGKLEAAAENYQRALQINPADADFHKNLGWVLSRLGQKDEAVKHLNEALKLKPDDKKIKDQLRALEPPP